MTGLVSTHDVHALLTDGWKVQRPRYRGLAEALRSAIGSGEIGAGARLPAERDLAAALGVSRTTVVGAYDLLRRDGWLVSQTGRGTFAADRRRNGVALRMRDMVDGVPAAASARTPGPSDVINLSIARPQPLDGLLQDAIARSAESVAPLAEHLEYATQGLPELRSLLAEWFTGRGLPTTAAQILVTTGAQQAIGLLTQLFVEPGDTVMLESPTYLGAIDALRARRAQLVALPASDAPVDPEHVVKLGHRTPPALAFLMPTCHVITGAVLPAEGRELVAQLSLDLQMPLIEDDIFTGLTLEPEPRSPVAAYAEDAPVFTVGSTSKLLWNGIRVGWLRAPEAMVTRLARLKGTVDLGTSLIAQLVALHLLERRERIARMRRDEMRASWALASDLLERTLPEWTWRRPEGGRSLWLRLPSGTATEFAQIALRHGVVVVAGPGLSPDAGNDDRLRMMYVQRPSTLVEGVERLGVAWADYAHRR